MAAAEPTVVATSMGFRPGRRTYLEPGPVFDLMADLAGGPSRPKLCYIGTANGDQLHRRQLVREAFQGTGFQVTDLALFTMPNHDDMRAHLLDQDVVWVDGGSVAGLLAMWQLHGLGDALRAAWEAGVVLGGVSAGSLCWHVGGTTDSFGPDLRPVTNGLAFLPYGNGVHYDSERQRRPLLQRLVADGTLPLSYATDDGVGLVYRGTELVEAVADTRGVAAYRVRRVDDGRAEETRIEPRLLG
ncbi:Type 1 glutamine amidotransferase-like domain-containing protein [Motilibacter aurantiacus]|uniref:Type 1 glutamine amidotransferase-like domain-containing protein n=1 Tax=Motilibacter aurantiacus TaxID=2714955 RepID=UPI00140C48D7|nr:peptidase E [Motilibacter aurantiacus]NHC44945.1 peptidase E [Motilibacter aurantiacus]